MRDPPPVILAEKYPRCPERVLIHLTSNFVARRAALEHDCNVAMKLEVLDLAVECSKFG